MFDSGDFKQDIIEEQLNTLAFFALVTQAGRHQPSIQSREACGRMRSKSYRFARYMPMYAIPGILIPSLNMMFYSEVACSCSVFKRLSGLSAVASAGDVVASKSAGCWELLSGGDLFRLALILSSTPIRLQKAVV